MGLSCSKFLNPFNKTEYSYVPTAKGLPLLRLPFFALLEIFKSLDPIELFILSHCSRKVTNYVHIVGSKKWRLSVDVGNKCITINDKYRLTIVETSQKPSWKYDRDSKSFPLEYQNSENDRWLNDRGLKFLFIEYQHSGDSKLELQKVLSQLLISFKCPVTSFEYDDTWKSDQCWFSVLNYIIQNQTQRLETFDLVGTFERDDLEWALQNMKTTRKINIHLLGTLNFTSHFQPECEQFTFRSTYLLRLDLMTYTSCKYMLLTLSLTMHDLDVFMRVWKTGGFPNLQYMGVGVSTLTSSGSVLGFTNFELIRWGEWRTVVIDEELSRDCFGGVDIQSDNGLMATMRMEHNPYDWFELFVWNN